MISFKIMLSSHWMEEGAGEFVMEEDSGSLNP